MAKRTTTVLVDDIDGTTADESLAFALDGVMYEIDLSSAHAAELRGALRPYIQKGRKVRGRQARSVRAAVKSDRATVRAWANQNGWELGQRGRIPTEVLNAYELAQG
jgi:hypothetical protein